jgi:hypothetical protein
MVTDAGPEATTPRQGSLLPASCGWAEPQVQGQEGGVALATQGGERGGEKYATSSVKFPTTKVKSPLPRTSLKSKFDRLVLGGVRIAITGSFSQSEDGKLSKLGPARDLFMGKNYIRRLIILHGARYNDSVYPNTNFLLVGNGPAKMMVEKSSIQGHPPSRVWHKQEHYIRKAVNSRGTQWPRP